MAIGFHFSSLKILLAVTVKTSAMQPNPGAVQTDSINSTIEMAERAAGHDWYAVQAVASTSDRTFLSHDARKSVDLWSAVGSNQEWRITLVEGDVYNIEAASVPSTGRTFLSHNGAGLVDLWTSAGSHQQWKIREAPDKGAYVIEAAHGAGAKKYLSHDGEHSVDLWGEAGENQFWRIPNFRLDSAKRLQEPISPGECADPFVWRAEHKFHMICTGGRLSHYTGDRITERFKDAGSVLPGKTPAWSPNGHRWAPETVQVGSDNYVFFSSPSYSEHGHPHRIGWARADGSTGGDGAWDKYAGKQWFNDFTKTPGGEIDPSVYQEADEKGVQRHYLLWKSDDNAADMQTTRLWMQEITFHNKRPQLQGSPKKILESGDLWWVSSWTADGALIEGPELLRHGGYYYLFFATGRFCKADYAEGVARSRSLWGPYEKSPDPVVSTGTVGHVRFEGKTPKIVGPGHAGFFKQAETWYMVWHGSPGYNCKRHAFVSPLRWEGGWPRLA
mmetsp:Transcript_71808/g.162954  ORF Transcript_71808/g.162954 Transcript_71808/m.162954 type:complete len:501 (-) Transcript_71808:93-1595(-)|eukprot:CAMPEP_0197913680 /NCGR_PEP_ID=MMETSP1439-20131203/77047_1 /TAXON_ID=66791 /ORGANISM="Gonyaulax spinifera, Strain CCMP409" /LENGTH=500 /DNA_ID=CAMNT_0043535549 /DNA_START=95 /DNA_END=1600 /DNA_ORIENTATION=+